MRIRSLSLPLLLVSIFLSSCSFHCSIGGNDTAKQPATSPVEKNGAVIYNGIELESQGLHVKEAYLVYTKSGQMLPGNNQTDFREPIGLRLVVDSGWTVEDGNVYPGASEKMVSEKGNVLLNQEDLFQKYNGGGAVAAADAKYITLSVSLKGNADNSKSFTVEFRVWDKKSEGFVKGKFKLFLE